MERDVSWGIFSEVYKVVSGSPVSVTLSVVGFVLFAFAMKFASKAVKPKPEETTRSEIYLLYISLVGALIFSIAGPLVELFSIEKKPAFQKITSLQGLENLKANAPVRWVVRLIPYDPNTQQELSIQRLSRLGKPAQRFTFVADYEELQGYTVSQAVRKLGGQIMGGNHVTAVVFPLKSNIYPANAKGLLQVIHLVANPPNSQKVKGLEPVEKRVSSLSENAREYLKNPHRESWSWKRYGEYYGDYCQVAQFFRCSLDTDAKSLIGEISHDWHPLGFSRMEAPESCSTKERVCDVKDDWKPEDFSDKFGTRVFFIENFEIAKLNGHFLFNLHDPDTQILPYVTTVPQR